MSELVEIAKDVLQRLDEGKLVAKKGYYIASDEYVTLDRSKEYDNIVCNDEFEQKYGSNLKGALEELAHKGPCHVCALGGLIMSAVDKYGSNVPSRYARNVERVLEPYLNIKDAALIEYCFEGSPNGILCDSAYKDRRDYEQEEWEEEDCDVIFEYASDSNMNIYRSEYDKARSFYLTFQNAEERMRKLMENIVNNGAFNIDKL